MSNPYESTDPIAEKASRGIQSLRTTSLVLLLLNLVITVLVVLGLVRTNSFAPLLADFDMDLPQLTQIMFSPWTIGGLIALALVSVAKEILLKSGRGALIFNAAQLPLLLTVWQLQLEAKWLPFIRLIETLR